MVCLKWLQFKAALCNLCIYFTCLNHAPPGLGSKAGGWLMTMESINLSDFMCLHSQLATVLTSSFNGNHWIVWLCSVLVCMYDTWEKISPILINWLKTTILFHFALCPLFFPSFLTAMDHHRSPWPLLPRPPNLFTLGNSRKYLTWMKEIKRFN